MRRNLKICILKFGRILYGFCVNRGLTGEASVAIRMAMALIAFLLPGGDQVSGRPAGADSRNMYSLCLEKLQKVFCPILSGKVLQKFSVLKTVFAFADGTFGKTLRNLYKRQSLRGLLSPARVKGFRECPESRAGFVIEMKKKHMRHSHLKQRRSSHRNSPLRLLTP
jgi:hypothetical protein